MQTQKLKGVPAAYLAATAVASILNVILTVAKESYNPLFAWLAATFRHHWIGQGVILLISWVILVAIFYPIYSRRKTDYYKLSMILVAAVLISTLGIMGFYLRELLG